MRIWLFFFWMFAQAAVAQERAPLILVSFDGFRWDYPDLIDTPHINALFREGFRVKRMEPSFPSITFPNHYTLVTGLHPGHHGLVGNRIYDAKDRSHYDLYVEANVVDPKWYQAPAIWEIAREHGLVSASYFWVGSQVKGRHPNIFRTFDKKVDIDTRLNTLAQWLDPKAQPAPDLILLYFHEVDTAGHHYGPDSPELMDSVQQADAIVGRIHALIQASKRKVNLIIVSDHGMISQDPEGMKLSLIQQAVGKDLVELMNNYSQVDLFTKSKDPKKLDELIARLPKHPKVRWVRHENAPGAVHPTRNGDIMGIASPGFYFMRDIDSYALDGGHGYDEKTPEMGAICFGTGPAFKKAVRLDSVRSVDVFSLLLKVLGLPQRKTDGSLDVWAPILNETP